MFCRVVTRLSSSPLRTWRSVMGHAVSGQTRKIGGGGGGGGGPSGALQSLVASLEALDANGGDGGGYVEVSRRHGDVADQVESLQAVFRAMDDMALGDVELRAPGVESMEPMCFCLTPPWGYVPDTDRYDICVFYLPKGFEIPWHDHPHMTVLSRVLQGALEVSSLSWADPAALTVLPQSADGSPPSAHLHSATDPTWSLGPSRGNVHRFRAVENTFVLDVLVPPYSSLAGRECSYYHLPVGVDSDAKGGEDESVWTLQLVEEPDNLPQFVEHRILPAPT